MHLLPERRAAVGDYRAIELAYLRIADRRSDAAIGDDAGEIELRDATFAQAPFEPRGVERRKCDLLYIDICGRERIDQLLPKTARREVALLEERPQRLEMRRDERLAAAPGHQGEQRCDDQYPVLACGTHQRRQARGQGGD